MMIVAHRADINIIIPAIDFMDNIICMNVSKNYTQTFIIYVLAFVRYQAVIFVPVNSISYYSSCHLILMGSVLMGLWSINPPLKII